MYLPKTNSPKLFTSDLSLKNQLSFEVYVFISQLHKTHCVDILEEESVAFKWSLPVKVVAVDIFDDEHNVVFVM